MSDTIKKLFNDISPTYDKLNHLLSFNVDKRWRKKTVKTIKASPDTPLVALDLCAGTLDLTLTFLESFPKAQICALDFSQNMLEVGKKKIPPQFQNQVSLHCADALKMPFPDDFFDLVFCGYGFRNLDDKQKGLFEINRVLKKGGEVLILDFFKPANIFSKLFHTTYGQFLLPLVGGVISGNRQAYQYLNDSVKGFLTTNELKELFKKQNIRSEDSIHYFMGISSLVVGVKS